MYRAFHYYSRYQGLRGNVSSLPQWGKPLLFLAALPGILLIALSIVLFLVSLLALLLLTAPVYRVLQALAHKPVAAEVDSPRGPDPFVEQTGPRRQVDVKILD